LAFSPNGRRLVLSSRALSLGTDDDLPVLDVSRLQMAFQFKGIGDATFDPQGRWLTNGRQDGSIVIRDPQNGHELVTLNAGKLAPIRVLFRPDGRALAAIKLRGSLHLWDTETWKPIEPLMPTEKQVTAIAWTPDSKFFAIAFPAEVQILDAVTRSVVRKIPMRHVPLVLGFSPDGGTLAIGGRSRVLDFYVTATREHARSLVGNPATVNSQAFHPNGMRIATTGADGFIRIWDVTTGQEVLALPNGGTDSFGVAWDPSGRDLFTVGRGLRVWKSNMSFPVP